MRPSRKKIAEVLASRIKRGESLSKLSKETAAYLLDSGRSNELESLMRDVMAIRADDGQVEVSLTTAHKLDGKTDKEIKQLVKSIRPNAKSVQIDEQVDPSLIGGLKLNVINQSLDLSIRAKLNKLKQTVVQGGA